MERTSSRRIDYRDAHTKNQPKIEAKIEAIWNDLVEEVDLALNPDDQVSAHPDEM